MSIAARFTWSPVGLAVALASVVTPAAAADFAGSVDIGGGRAMYLQCSGAGSPTVVLISGKGNGAADWSEILDPADPAHDADYDAVAWGKGDLHKSEQAVFPMVSRFTRVCAYDRPDVRLDGPDRSTPVAQPHLADQAADDLHRLLEAAGEPGPYVLVPHSYGGVVATLFARTWPDEVDGLVMVDTVTPLMRQVAGPQAVAMWDAFNAKSVPAAPEAVMLIDAFAKIDAASPLRELPAVVLGADKPWQPPSAGNQSAPGAGVTFADWKASERLLAASLNAGFITRTNSGHGIHNYSPQLVIDAIREVVDAVRAGEAVVASAGETDPATRPIDPDARAALDKALDESFAGSGLPGAVVGVWIPGTGSWIATRGVADLESGRAMAADLQAPIGSITKTFTATIALQLIGEGRLGLDDTIDRWYPQVPEAAAITIRMLLDHSSGLPDISQLQLDLHCADPAAIVTPDELIDSGIALPRAAFAPGKGNQYSSLNTLIVGRILEMITDQSFDDLLNARLIGPLGLNRTRLDTDGVLAPPFSHGYTDFCPNLPPLTDTSAWRQFSFSAGALASTLPNLRAWGVALGEGVGLTPALRQARLDDGLGIGVQREPGSGRVISIGHAGSEPGYSANVQYYPCTGAVWALMVNGDGGTGEAFIAVLAALQPLVEPLVDPSTGCSVQ
jgi:D-alanyl-D-alanine carboxypeptidase